MKKYKKGDYIVVMTNQPDIHFIEMFGHGLSTDDVEPSEYVAIKMNRNKDEPFVSKLNKKRDYFNEMLQHLRFKEYYTIRVGVVDEKDTNATNYLYLFVDTRFEEVVITRNIQERTRFFRSVGPEYDSIGNYISDFRLEVLTGEEHIKIDL